ncbi:hypothetical protein Pla52n_24710 [Stieleria varia]|uniref:Uncharacterized protein n=1 Tax=Stieleria varia TaxID=2528005 RepID=A0A5C6AXH5_9BACT|nr:hypothetical protein Pla52n_24710 [Stieleria varia]
MTTMLATTRECNPLQSRLLHRPVLILGLAVLALATVVARKPWLTPKRLIYRTHVLRLDDALRFIPRIAATHARLS